MRKFIYLIGSTDDFDGIESIKFAYFNEPDQFAELNASDFEFELPDACDDEVATLYARGLAFSNGWCMDDTVSILMGA